MSKRQEETEWATELRRGRQRGWKRKQEDRKHATRGREMAHVWSAVVGGRDARGGEIRLPITVDAQRVHMRRRACVWECIHMHVLTD